MSLALPSEARGTRRVHRARPIPDLNALPATALITRQQLCAATGYALPTVKAWPGKNKGPRVTMVEGRPRYLVSDVRAWLGLDAP